MRFVTQALPAVRLHVLPTRQFKTTTLVLNFQRPLAPGAVTATALLPGLLGRGSARYPSVVAQQRALEAMYGAHWHADVYKQGERHVLQFRLEIPNGAYLPGSPDFLAEAFALLHEFVFDPKLVAEAFDPRWVELEKDALRKRVEGLFNNKAQFAFLRLLELMCPDEPYRLFSGGRIEDLPALGPAELTRAYRETLEAAPADCYVVGDVDPAQVKALAERHLSWTPRAVAPLPPTSHGPAPASPRAKTESYDLVSQGQLLLGYRVPVTYRDDDYHAMVVMNGILGGFSHSKLFMNVREKASLAYAVRSRYESHKGFVIVQAGVEPENAERAAELIKAQLAAMAAGDVSDTELSQTQAMLLNLYREARDSAGALINVAYESVLGGRERGLEDALERVPLVTKADVVRLARTLTLDSEYLLRDRERVEAGA